MVDAWGKDGGGGTGLGSSSKPKDLERSATGSASFKSESGSKKGKGDGKAVGDADLRPVSFSLYFHLLIFHKDCCKVEVELFIFATAKHIVHTEPHFRSSWHTETKSQSVFEFPNS